MDLIYYLNNCKDIILTNAMDEKEAKACILIYLDLEPKQISAFRVWSMVP